MSELFSDRLLHGIQWSAKISEAIEKWPYAPKREWPAIAVHDWLTLVFPGSTAQLILQQRIRAELAGARRAREVAKAIVSEYARVATESYDDGRLDAARELLEALDGTPD